VLDEDLRKRMELALVNGDYAAALELSQELDQWIVNVQKLKNMSAVVILLKS
jgi:hypothetical protein